MAQLSPDLPSSLQTFEEMIQRSLKLPVDGLAYKISTLQRAYLAERLVVQPASELVRWFSVVISPEASQPGELPQSSS